jgi:large-conductance mechanosensitive channel
MNNNNISEKILIKNKENEIEKETVKKVNKDIKKQLTNKNFYDKLIDLLNSSDIISLSFATTFGYALNNYLTNLSTSVIIPLFNVKNINFSSLNYNKIKFGNFLEHSISFFIIITISLIVLWFVARKSLNKVEEEKIQTIKIREKQSTNMISILSTINDNIKLLDRW